MKILFVLLFFLLALFSPLKTYAHDLQIDHAISATMHIDPNDDPLVRSPSILSFTFKDQQNKFRGEICTCTITIKKSGQTIYAQQLFNNTESSHLFQTTVQYTFPETGAYQIIITGNPQYRNGFQPFTLSYTVQAQSHSISPVTTKTTTGNTLIEKRIIDFIVTLLGVGSVLLLLGALRAIKQEKI